MGIMWIFFFLILLCAYILFGLYTTDGITDFKTICLTWIIYTCLWLTFSTVFLLAYFWGNIRTKTGPPGIRGISGERGESGLEGTCSVTATQAEAVKQMNTLIDALYTEKTAKSILNQDTQKFPNNYLSNKIATIGGSKQYKVMYLQASELGKTPQEVINYVKGIWKTWFELIYAVNPGWFEDEFADEDYDWPVDTNPFDEIKKYDMYYWGLLRGFRQMKAEICRSNNGFESAKLPLKKMNQSTPARLKIMETNDYMRLGGDSETKGDPDASWFRPRPITIGEDTYYPLGDIPTWGNSDWNSQKSGNTIVGDMSYNPGYWTGPDMKTIIVSGDVVNPINYQSLKWHGGDDAISSAKVNCPEGYESIGDIVGTGWGNPNYFDHNNPVKCVPKDCLIPIYGGGSFSAWYSRGINHMVKNNYTGDTSANPDNGYNLMRINNNKPYYKINPKCLESNNSKQQIPDTKDPEDENSSLGIGWNGHPYKDDPRYSIFTFLGLVPEGMIVHKTSGRRFYIIHYGGEDVNKYVVLDYNVETDKFDAALQVDDNPGSNTVNTRVLSRRDDRQQWTIVLDTDKHYLKLKNIINNKYLSLDIQAKSGNPLFSTSDLKSGFPQNTIFSFISTFGTQMDIIDNDANPSPTATNSINPPSKTTNPTNPTNPASK